MGKRIIEESGWWWAAVYGEAMPLHESTPPQPGFYKCRLIPRGAYFPAHVWIERQEDESGQIIADDRYFCEIGTEIYEPFKAWLWICGHPITREEHESMMEVLHVAVRAD